MGNQGQARGTLIVFTRLGEPGRVKTRLIPALGAGGAAELQRRMTQRTLATAREFAAASGARVEVHFEGGSAELMRREFGRDFTYRRQARGDLGTRMNASLDGALGGGGAAVLIGTDVPGVTAAILQSAFDALATRDAVFGPASDGGYYLVGLTKRAPEIFREMTWGTPGVLEETLRRAGEAGLAAALVEKLSDVDRPEDISIWERVTGRAALAPISVVIAALDEEENIAAALRVPMATRGVERIVVDGGSSDRTREIAAALGARVLEAARGRAGQLNAGARAATGEILVFLHADSRLPEGFDRYVREALATPGVSAGAFRFKTDSRAAGMRAIERLVNFRSEFMGMPYGDQGIFLYAERFREAGGWPEMAIMEDYEFVKRLARMGRVVTVGAAVVTSGRRWEARGVLWTTVVNQLMIAGYELGLSPSSLTRLYGRVRG